MVFAHCSLCGKLFNSTNNTVCDQCDKEEVLNIKKICEYLDFFEKPYTKVISTNTLSKATGVKLQEIERLYKANKLRTYTGLLEIDCKLCGKGFKPTFLSGVLCKNCVNKVEKVADELTESSKKSGKQNDTDEKHEILKSKKTKEETSQKNAMHVRKSSKNKYGFIKD